MGAIRHESAWVMGTLWVAIAVLAAVEAISVPVESSPKHRRQSPLSPAQSIHEIDKQFATVGNHLHEQHHDASGSRPVYHQAIHHPAAPAEAQHGARVAHAHPGHKSGRGSHKQQHRPVEHVAPYVHAAASHHHRVGPKSLLHAHEAQMASSDHVPKSSSGHKSSGHTGSGKTHSHSGGKTLGGGDSEHHHYEHNRGEDEKQHRAREYEEGEGARKHYDHDDFKQSSHGHSGHGGHDAKHMEFNHRDKGGYSKGFRDKYHKDEHHKLDKYWNNGHEKGAYEKFGLHNSRYQNSDKGKSKKSQHKEGKKVDSYGKKGQHGKGHFDTDSKGHKGHGGHEAAHAQHNDYSKKGGSSFGKAHHFEHGKNKA